MSLTKLICTHCHSEMISRKDYEVDQQFPKCYHNLTQTHIHKHDQ
jgi:hypothetical protein